MEAKDTVLTDRGMTIAIGSLSVPEWEKIAGLPESQRDRIVQAEISFKVGERQGVEKGMKKVVEVK